MQDLNRYRYVWPTSDLSGATSRWKRERPDGSLIFDMPESPEELAVDSRWPAFFPSPTCLVTASDGQCNALEKVVGASIVNRFPYVLALSFCKRELSHRHHVRASFTSVLENGGTVAVQYIPPGNALDRAMDAVLNVPEEHSSSRIDRSGLKTRTAVTNGCPVFTDAYMVYEGKLVSPGKDFEGDEIFPEPWVDVGSHRVYFLEITCIQLREDIASGRSQVHWRSLPAWQPEAGADGVGGTAASLTSFAHYLKGYTPQYAFPSAGTIAFEADGFENGMAIKRLPPLPEDQVEVDNDRARWPCFFPSSAALITTWTDDGLPNLMPCGSTTVISRHPFVIAPCVSYAAINERYAPRQSLELIRKRGKFGCGVPFISDAVITAIRYAGNVSIASDPHKVAHSGLSVVPNEWAPELPALPIHSECEVVGEVRLGTHIMFLGEVRRIRVRADVRPDNPVEWYPWACVRPVSTASELRAEAHCA